MYDDFVVGFIAGITLGIMFTFILVFVGVNDSWEKEAIMKGYGTYNKSGFVWKENCCESKKQD